MPIFFAVAAAMLPLIVRFFVLSVVIAAVVKLFRLQCPLLAFFSSRNFHGVRCVCVFLLAFFFCFFFIANYFTFPCVYSIHAQRKAVASSYVLLMFHFILLVRRLYGIFQRD